MFRGIRKRLLSVNSYTDLFYFAGFRTAVLRSSPAIMR
jgi:hypothetical protein